MDREDIKQSMQVIQAVTKELEKGRNYLIFPEGTRSKNGNKVGEFKGGSFKAAMKAKYGVEHALQKKEFLEHVYQTNLDRIRITNKP